MTYIFCARGKMGEVIKALLIAAKLEAKFGRWVEPLEPTDFSKQ